MRKIGIAVLILGVIVLASGIGVIALLPWQDINLGEEPTQPLEMPPEFQRVVTWLLFTGCALIVNLFLSGTALVIVGYGLYRVENQKTEMIKK